MSDINTMVFETMTGPGGHIADGSGPPLRGKGMGPGKGKQYGSENIDLKKIKKVKEEKNEDQ